MATRMPRAVPVWTGRGQTIVNLTPGQMIFGRHTAAKALKCSGSSIQYRLQTLKKHKMIVIQPVTHYSVITVINWASYQGEAPAGSQPTRHSPRHPSVTHPSQTRIKESETKPTTGANGVQPFLDLYIRLFREKVGHAPVINFGKDGAILKGLIKVLGEDSTRTLIRRFFSSPDPFIQKTGYSIGVLQSQANRLMTYEDSNDSRGCDTAGRPLEELT